MAGWQTVLVSAIVAGCSVWLLRTVWRAVCLKQDAGGGCGSSCRSCVHGTTRDAGAAADKVASFVSLDAVLHSAEQRNPRRS